MIYSRSVEYAIRALAHLAAQPQGAKKMARQIADDEGLPAFFLAKTLQQLARKGLLRSVKGPTGGFGLNLPAGKICLLDIIAVLDGTENIDRGVTDLPNFRPIRMSLVNYLRTTTIADVANGRKKHRRSTGSKKVARKSTRRSN